MRATRKKLITYSFQNLQVFSELGVSDWVFYDEKYRKFFNWFSQNITESNILTDTEIRE